MEYVDETIRISKFRAQLSALLKSHTLDTSNFADDQLHGRWRDSGISGVAERRRRSQNHLSPIVSFMSEFASASLGGKWQLTDVASEYLAIREVEGFIESRPDPHMK
jgi:hypothetical protein